MKYWKALVIVALVVVLIIIGLIFLFQPSTKTVTEAPIQNPFADTTTATNDPSAFVKNCFQSYIPAYIAQLRVTNPTQFSDDAKACFTPDFIAQWPSIISNSESDPVLLSQDYYPSWETDISTIVSSQTPTNSTVIVNLGAGSELIGLVVNLESTPSGWRISSVTKPQ